MHARTARPWSPMSCFAAQHSSSGHHHMHSCHGVGRFTGLLRPVFRGSQSALRQRAHVQPLCQQSRGIFAQARKGLSQLLSLEDEKDSPPSRQRLKQGKVAPELEVPAHILRPPYAATYEHVPWNEQKEVHDEEGLKKMRASCKLAAQVLQHAGTLVKPGVTTDEIDRAVHKMVIENGAYPSPLRYGQFPKSVCTSVNECVCHGIPDSRQLQDGDIVNIDVTVYLNGYHGDTSSMFLCGKVSDEAKQLCEVTKLALNTAIKECRPGVPVNKIGATCQKIADEHRVKSVADFCGHGVGKVFHAAPMVQHTRNGVREKMQAWQTFTIEPIFVAGSPRYHTWPDKWTIITNDGGLAAQYEHTILVTPDGHEILTLP